MEKSLSVLLTHFLVCYLIPGKGIVELKHFSEQQASRLVHEVGPPMIEVTYNRCCLAWRLSGTRTLCTEIWSQKTCCFLTKKKTLVCWLPVGNGMLFLCLLLYVTDFGLSQILKQPNEPMNVPVGTPAYLARMLPLEITRSCTCVYGLGCVCVCVCRWSNGSISICSQRNSSTALNQEDHMVERYSGSTYHLLTWFSVICGQLGSSFTSWFVDLLPSTVWSITYVLYLTIARSWQQRDVQQDKSWLLWISITVLGCVFLALLRLTLAG